MSLHSSHEVASIGRRERRRIETRERIVTAALGLFHSRSYPEITVEDITEAADIGKGTFFNYFATKDAVLTAIFDAFGEKFERFQAHVQEVRDVRSSLRQFAQQLLEQPSRSPRIIRSIFGQALTDPAIGAGFEKTLMKGRSTVIALFAHGQRIGQIRTDIPADILGRTFQQFIFGTEMLWSFTSGEDLHHWVDVMFEVFWKGTEPQGISGPGAKQEERSS